VKIVHISSAGRRLALGVLGEGEIFGEAALLGKSEHRHLAQVLKDAQIYVLGQRVFTRFLQERPWLIGAFLKLLVQRKGELEQKLRDIAFETISVRLSRELLRLSERYGKETVVKVVGYLRSGIEIDCPLTHQDLAELIGSVRENVTKELNFLAREGILDKTRYRITIIDKDRLLEQAGWIR
jgi:CRP-like cAMP-binding protein